MIELGFKVRLHNLTQVCVGPFPRLGSYQKHTEVCHGVKGLEFLMETWAAMLTFSVSYFFRNIANYCSFCMRFPVDCLLIVTNLQNR